MRKLLAVSVLTVFLLAIALPVAAFEHEATYKWEGTITFSQQAGHFCNTGAEMQQRITGQGSMLKEKSVYMEEGYIMVDDANDWVTAPDAIRNLTVTTAIMLCAPPKTLWDIPDDFNAGALNQATVQMNREEVREFLRDITGVRGIGPLARLLESWDGDVMPPEILYGLLNFGFEPWQDALTEQIWAVQVAADPGYSGRIDMTFEAANSNNWVDGKSDMDAYNGFWFADEIYEDWPGYSEQKKGPWFPGSYFNIEQFSRTSQGTHRRYIDISSPWSHGFLNESMTVVGMSEVWEAFSMDNLTAGDEVGALWWDLF